MRPFVGRSQERTEIAEALAAVAHGRGRAYLVSGEPGIGKTRLCDQISNAVGGLDMRVLDDAELAGALGDGASTFSELVPGTRARLAEKTARTAGIRAADEARFLLHRSGLGLLRTASEARSTLIVIDDLHAADEASLQLLRFVAPQ